MRKKLLIIWDIIFNNGKYLKATEDLYIKDNLYIEEKIVYPIKLHGRVILTREQSENLPDNVVFTQACCEILKSSQLLDYVEKSKFEVEDSEYFLKDIKKTAYNVVLNIIPN